MQTTQLIVYLVLILSFIRYFKAHNKIVMFSAIYCVGYFAFLLIWEANPRYTLGVFPSAMILMALYFNKTVLDTPNNLSRTP